ncbi:hypothetical protein LshimejAT787_0604630 [Lyophyllum shimeji]|uniref:Uncharacterized protein n=1 Tax=Lyophyllum shimeji TaxID=47721 RepID=A0A9P3PQ18_LYOSH|nr:hypothetical protein LshimejAT787_0604630 [Lyophyllum shimeji]
MWQRFGRVARGQEQQGTAILLVEKKDTDDERVAKERRAEKRKKKPGTGTKRKAKGDGNGRGKRPALADRSINRALNSGDAPNADELESDVETAEAEGAAKQAQAQVEAAFREERRVHYAKRDAPTTAATCIRKGKARAEVEVGSPMDNFINTQLCVISCRRVIIQVYFGND